MLDDGQRLIIACAFGMALLLGACTLGPDFGRPRPALPDSWTEAGAAKPTDEVSSDWWRGFKDPALDRLIARATTANQDMRLAMERVDAARIERGETAAQALPTIGAQAAYGRDHLSTKGIASLARPLIGLDTDDSRATPHSLNFNEYGVGAAASWELDLWGRQRRLREAADARVEQSIADAAGTRLSVQAEVARTYFRWRELDAIHPYLDAAVAVAEDQLRIAETLKARGFVAAIDASDPAAGLRSSRATRDEAATQARMTRRALAILVGGSPEAPLPELDGRLVEPVLADVPVVVPSALVRNRPDIVAAEARLHAATAAIGVAKADFYPGISLTGQLSIDVLKLADFGWGARNSTFGPSLTLPIFDGGRLRQQLALTESRQREAALGYQTTVMNAWREVEDALATEHMMRDRFARQLADTAARRATFDARVQQAVRGDTSKAVVLEAQDALLRSLVAVINAKTELIDSKVRALISLGPSSVSEVKTSATSAKYPC